MDEHQLETTLPIMREFVIVAPGAAIVREWGVTR